MPQRQHLCIRALTDEEYATLEICATCTGGHLFAERRSHIFLASSVGKPPLQIAAELQIDDETVRRAIRDFNQHGMIALLQRSRKPKHTRDHFIPGGRDRLLAVLQQNPRYYGHNTNEWTLELIADTAFAEGITKTRVSDETIRQALVRLEIKWSTLKHLLRREYQKSSAPHRRMIA
ncbi:MAG: helix-turn-helix domain-containing protein [Oscillochloris sp.]|nr:helix-turn-helix domain-containing protein [Oscillochloris sp.]